MNKPRKSFSYDHNRLIEANGCAQAQSFCERYIPSVNTPFPNNRELALAYQTTALRMALEKAETINEGYQTMLRLYREKDPEKTQELVNRALDFGADFKALVTVLLTIDAATESIAIGDHDEILRQIRESVTVVNPASSGTIPLETQSMKQAIQAENLFPSASAAGAATPACWHNAKEPPK